MAASCGCNTTSMRATDPMSACANRSRTDAVDVLTLIEESGTVMFCASRAPLMMRTATLPSALAGFRHTCERLWSMRVGQLFVLSCCCRGEW
jgi:hypothetical protein